MCTCDAVGVRPSHGNGGIPCATQVTAVNVSSTAMTYLIAAVVLMRVPPDDWLTCLRCRRSLKAERIGVKTRRNEPWPQEERCGSTHPENGYSGEKEQQCNREPWLKHRDRRRRNDVHGRVYGDRVD